jgi:putative hydrolase of the HAD superfamily
VIDWLLVDYGEVLSRALPEATFTELAAMTGLDRDEFRERYWRYRPDYDRGQTPLRYWSALIDRDMARQRRLVERLTAVDVNGWTHLNPATLRTTLNTARRTPTGLALLSNAPEALADAIERSHWVSHFDHRFYSCRLRRLKPEPAAFTDALNIMDATPEQVLFIDDRAENTAAAADLGMSTITFASADALLHQIARATEARRATRTEPDRELPTFRATIA